MAERTTRIPSEPQMTDLPAAAVDLHTAVLGMTGSGKTTTGKLIIEDRVAQGDRVCILDPIKSDWWGLTSSADGKSPGLPFTILGGPRGHVALHSGAGHAIAEVVASGELRHSIIDMADFEAGGLQNFFTDFAHRLLQRMRGVLYLVIEEAHEFAPKERGGFGKENQALHYAKKLATAGRSKGIRLVVMTQRTQALHNAILGSCPTKIVHRMTEPADQEPVVKWLKRNADKARGEEITDSLSRLPTGTGWVCNAEIGLFERVQFPRARTYDNSATPDRSTGEHDVRTAKVDVAALRAAIGEAVKEAEASDPKALKAELAAARARIAELESGASTRGASGDEELAAAEARGYERGKADGIRLRADALRTDLAAVLSAIGDARAEHHERFSAIESKVQALAVQYEYARNDEDHASEPPRTAPPRSDYVVMRISNPAPSDGSGTVTDKAQRAFLTVLAQHRRALARNQIAILAGYSSKSSHVDNTISNLRTRGYVTGGRNGIEITAEGRKALGKYTPLPVGRALQEYWIRELDSAGGKFLTIICAAHPRTVTRDQVAEKAGYSTISSHVDNTLSALRTRGLITGPRGAIKASEELFG